MYMKGQKVLVLGLGKSGLAATRLLRSKGAEVCVRDEADTPALRQRAEEARGRGAVVELGGKFGEWQPFNFCVISPGIDPRSPLVTELARRNTPIIGEIELGYRFLKCPVVAVTGTNGKTTTTALVTHVLRAAGRNAVAAGNFGVAVCDVLNENQFPDMLVLEVSSFQLETIRRFRPHVAVILNLSPNHLDRYARFEDYVAAKARVLLNMCEADTLVYKEECADFLSGDLEACAARKVRFTAGKPLHGFEYGLTGDGTIIGGTPTARDSLLRMEETKLRGKHNAENLMAAAAVAAAFGVPKEKIVEALKSFEPLPHRCETVTTIGGVQFVNDSKATSLDALEKALSAFDAPVVLIAGGRNKGLDLGKMTTLIERRVKQLVLIGEASDDMARVWGRTVPFAKADSMKVAVQSAFRAATPGDLVLLSPACASLDMFESYEHRGEVFKQEVAKLSGQQK